MPQKLIPIIYLDLSDNKIDNKVEYCRQLLKLADIIEPGLTQFRGQLLYELQAVMEHQIKRKTSRDSTHFQVFVLLKIRKSFSTNRFSLGIDERGSQLL